MTHALLFVDLFQRFIDKKTDAQSSNESNSYGASSLNLVTSSTLSWDSCDRDYEDFLSKLDICLSFFQPSNRAPHKKKLLQSQQIATDAEFIGLCDIMRYLLEGKTDASVQSSFFLRNQYRGGVWISNRSQLCFRIEKILDSLKTKQKTISSCDHNPKYFSNFEESGEKAPEWLLCTLSKLYKHARHTSRPNLSKLSRTTDGSEKNCRSRSFIGDCHANNKTKENTKILTAQNSTIVENINNSSFSSSLTRNKFLTRNNSRALQKLEKDKRRFLMSKKNICDAWRLWHKRHAAKEGVLNYVLCPLCSRAYKQLVANASIPNISMRKASSPLSAAALVEAVMMLSSNPYIFSQKWQRLTRRERVSVRAVVAVDSKDSYGRQGLVALAKGYELTTEDVLLFCSSKVQALGPETVFSIESDDSATSELLPSFSQIMKQFGKSKQKNTHPPTTEERGVLLFETVSDFVYMWRMQRAKERVLQDILQKWVARARWRTQQGEQILAKFRNYCILAQLLSVASGVCYASLSVDEDGGAGLAAIEELAARVFGYPRASQDACEIAYALYGATSTVNESVSLEKKSCFIEVTLCVHTECSPADSDPLESRNEPLDSHYTTPVVDIRDCKVVWDIAEKLQKQFPSFIIARFYSSDSTGRSANLLPSEPVSTAAELVASHHTVFAECFSRPADSVEQETSTVAIHGDADSLSRGLLQYSVNPTSGSNTQIILDLASHHGGGSECSRGANLISLSLPPELNEHIKLSPSKSTELRKRPRDTSPSNSNHECAACSNETRRTEQPQQRNSLSSLRSSSRSLFSKSEDMPLFSLALPSGNSPYIPPEELGFSLVNRGTPSRSNNHISSWKEELKKTIRSTQPFSCAEGVSTAVSDAVVDAASGRSPDAAAETELTPYTTSGIISQTAQLTPHGVPVARQLVLTAKETFQDPTTQSSKLSLSPVHDISHHSPDLGICGKVQDHSLSLTSAKVTPQVRPTQFSVEFTSKHHTPSLVVSEIECAPLQMVTPDLRFDTPAQTSCGKVIAAGLTPLQNSHVFSPIIADGTSPACRVPADTFSNSSLLHSSARKDSIMFYEKDGETNTPTARRLQNDVVPSPHSVATSLFKTETPSQRILASSVAASELFSPLASTSSLLRVPPSLVTSQLRISTAPQSPVTSQRSQSCLLSFQASSSAKKQKIGMIGDQSVIHSVLREITHNN